MEDRTWTLKLMATDEHPETTVAGVSKEEAMMLLRGLMHGPRSPEYAYVDAVVRGERPREPLAA